MARVGNKEKVNVTISPYLKNQADDLIATEEFSSMSDLVSIALAEFIGAYNRRQKEKEDNCSGLVSATAGDIEIIE